MAVSFVTKKISPVRRCIDVLNSDVYSAINLLNKINAKKRCSLNSCTHYNVSKCVHANKRIPVIIIRNMYLAETFTSESARMLEV